MYGKSNMKTYITICKIDSQQEFAVWLRKLKQGLCINLEGWWAGAGRVFGGCLACAGRDWGKEEKGTTEDEMAGWHHRLDGHESE